MTHCVKEDEIRLIPDPPDKAYPPVDIEEEFWKPVEGFPGYEVSSEGKVRSFWERVITSRTEDGKIQDGGWTLSPESHLLRPEEDSRGRQRVRLRRDGKPSALLVHRLVLEAFVGPCPEGQEGCHGPNGRTDNSLKNLSWGTREKNNGEDKLRDGSDIRGEKHHQAKITKNEENARSKEECPLDSQTIRRQQ